MTPWRYSPIGIVAVSLKPGCRVRSAAVVIRTVVDDAPCAETAGLDLRVQTSATCTHDAVDQCIINDREHALTLS